MALVIPNEARQAVLASALTDPYEAVRNPPHGCVEERHSAPYLKEAGSRSDELVAADISSFIRAARSIQGIQALLLDVQAGEIRVFRKVLQPK